MKFIGRKAELAKLNAEYERDGSFVVIYGRRRISEKENGVLFSCNGGT